MDRVVNEFVARCRWFHEPLSAGRSVDNVKGYSGNDILNSSKSRPDFEEGASRFGLTLSEIRVACFGGSEALFFVIGSRFSLPAVEEYGDKSGRDEPPVGGPHRLRSRHRAFAAGVEATRLHRRREAHPPPDRGDQDREGL